MYNNTRLKIYALLFHFFIIVGMGHGMGVLGMVEIVGFGEWSEAEFTGSLRSPFKDYIHTVALSSLLGQIAIILSIGWKEQRVQQVLYLTGLLFLIASVIYLLLAAETTSGLYVNFFFCIPFFACTIWSLIRLAEKPIGRINKWMDT